MIFIIILFLETLFYILLNLQDSFLICVFSSSSLLYKRLEFVHKVAPHIETELSP